MRILVVLDSININDSSGSKANVALIKNLKKAGFHLKVYHYTRKEIQLEGIACVPVKEQKLTHWYFLSKAQLFLRRITSINLNLLIEKYFGFSFTHFNDTLSIKKGLLKETNFNPDWVLTLSKAGSFRPHKALLGIPKWHDKWLAYVHDPYPMHSYPRPYDWVEPGHNQKRDFFMQVAEKSKKVIYPSGLLAEWMESYYPPLKDKSLIIPHQIFPLETINENSPLFFKADFFSLIHAGSLMKQRNPRPLVNGYIKFLQETPGAKEQSQLIFIGTIDENHKDFLNQVAANHKQIVIQDKYMEFNQASNLQRLASMNIILESNAEISPFLPGKFPHAVQTNKYILHIGPKQSETANLLGKNYPFQIENKNEDDIKNCIKIAFSKWKTNPEDFLLNREDLVEYLSVHYIIKNKALFFDNHD
tara:strand:+ start:2635 stop:3888 length:1254 start_codon:yes stop_codon:yes gene_type:complete